MSATASSTPLSDATLYAESWEFLSARFRPGTRPAEAGEREEYDRCLADPAYFITTHCQVRSDRGDGLIPFGLYGYQREVLAAFQDHRELIILKARQLGISELVAAYAVWTCLRPAQTVILISQSEDDAKELLRKARTCHEHLPPGLHSPVLDPLRTSTLELTNGSRILPVAATARAGRGFSAQLLVFDEWAHQQFQEQIYAAAAPTAKSAGNRIIGLSSANGAGNFFARQWQLARNGGGAHPIFLPWHIRPGRDRAWYDEATKTLEDWQRAQEYPSTPDEAFILSGRARFDQAALSDIAAGCTDPPETADLGTDAEGRATGSLRTWRRPEPGRRYVIGADTAEGLPKGDYSAAVVLDFADGAEVAELHGRWSPDVFAGHLDALGRRYQDALLGVERNNHGHAVLLELRKHLDYPRLYRHEEYDGRTHGTTVHPPGWQTTSKSKPIMVDALAETIRDRRPYRNALFVAEARTYTVTDSGDTQASGNLHDDRVVAYAIAEQLRRRPTQGSADRALQHIRRRQELMQRGTPGPTEAPPGPAVRGVVLRPD